MPLQTSGAISLSNIQSEFGGSNPISISEYIRGGSLVPDTTANSAIPTSLSNISFNDFYGGDNTPAPPPGPPTPVASPLSSWSYSGGVGNTNYEIVTGLKFTNLYNQRGNYYFNDQGSGRIGGSNVVYTDEIGQAMVGDVINLEQHQITSSSYGYNEWFEFWHYGPSGKPFNGRTGWFQFAVAGNQSYRVTTSGLKKNVNLTVGKDVLPGSYGIAVALSYSTLNATTYRSWRSYSLQIYSDDPVLIIG